MPHPMPVIWAAGVACVGGAGVSHDTLNCCGVGLLGTNPHNPDLAAQALNACWGYALASAVPWSTMKTTNLQHHHHLAACQRCQPVVRADLMHVRAEDRHHPA